MDEGIGFIKNEQYSNLCPFIMSDLGYRVYKE